MRTDKDRHRQKLGVCAAHSPPRVLGPVAGSCTMMGASVSRAGSSASLASLSSSSACKVQVGMFT